MRNKKEVQLRYTWKIELHSNYYFSIKSLYSLNDKETFSKEDCNVLDKLFVKSDYPECFKEVVPWYEVDHFNSCVTAWENSIKEEFKKLKLVIKNNE